MPKKKILYISGSLGLGHITRDLAIAKELRKQNPEVELFWLAAHPANVVLKEVGENLLPDVWADETVVAEDSARGFKLGLMKYAFKIRKAWAQHLGVFKRIIQRKEFDLVIGDETYEIDIVLKNRSLVIDIPFVMIYDFIGVDAMTKNPLERLGVYINNRKWAKGYKRVPYPVDLMLFVGELEDVADKKFGFLLPNRRDWAKALCKFVGYIFQFDPKEYTDKAKVRSKLGYGKGALVVCSIGGTSIGKELLELCGQAYPLIRERIPDLRMVLVCGPRLSAKSLKVPEGVEVREYVPSLYEHFAACDLAIVQGGGTTTSELTALKRPFLYFPIEGHFGQELLGVEKLTRYQAGIKMMYSKTTPESLAEKVLSTLGKEVSYIPIPTDGAKKAAQLINELI
jgi:UDP-N-acetylglucosamine:LPS N-acetylglucosamine transferase